MSRIILIVVLYSMLTGGCWVNGTHSVSVNSPGLGLENGSRNSQANRQIPLVQDKDLKNINRSSSEGRANYIGYWSGMRGGQLRITPDTIYDLGSKEKSAYKEIPAVRKGIGGLQTGEEYLLEAEYDFPKSFLSKYISLSYNSDGTVGIMTYESYDSYLRGEFVGYGLFGKRS